MLHYPHTKITDFNMIRILDIIGVSMESGNFNIENDLCKKQKIVSEMEVTGGVFTYDEAIFRNRNFSIPLFKSYNELSSMDQIEG